MSGEKVGENPNALAAPPTESMANAVTVEAPGGAESATPREPSTSSPAASAAQPQLQRVVGLPARPRLRVSWWFEGDKLVAEGVLMDERRELVRRAKFDADADPTYGRMFSYIAAQLVADLRASGVILTAPAATAEAPSSSEETPPNTAREGSTS